MRERIGPYRAAQDLRSAVALVQNTVFSGVANLEWSRLIVDFIECTVGLAALYVALHHGAAPTRFSRRRWQSGRSSPPEHFVFTSMLAARAPAHQRPAPRLAEWIKLRALAELD